MNSRADLLLYAYGQVDGSLRVWLLDLPHFRKWFLKSMAQFPDQDTRNREGYTTRSKVVPLVEIPASCILIRDYHVERSKTEVADWNAVVEEDELDEELAWDSCQFGYNLGHPSFLPPIDWHGDLLDMVEMGTCGRCGGVHIKCHRCDTIIAVHETEYGDELRCGCKKGIYQVVRDYDGSEEALEVIEEPGE